jgi:hypothetical protein
LINNVELTLLNLLKDFSYRRNDKWPWNFCFPALVEFALFTRWGRRLLMRGDTTYVPFTPGMAKKKWAKRGWRWSAHTHPHGGGNLPLTPSSGMGRSHDAAVLWRFSQYGTQRYSAIYDLEGNWRVFRPNEDIFFQPGWGVHK